jgi:glycosyltransferase involved in cell wall biosynthesis/predicted O-methyltransferase YrrM
VCSASLSQRDDVRLPGLNPGKAEAARLHHDRSIGLHTMNQVSSAVAKASPTRILIVTDDPGEGGVARYVTEISCGLAAAGATVIVAQTNPGEESGLKASRPGVEHVWLPYHTRAETDRLLGDTASSRAILKAARPDLVLFANCAPVSQMASTWSAAEAGIPYVIVEGFAAPYAEFTVMQAGLVHHQRILYERARAVIAVSQATLAILRSHYGLHPCKGEVIHYGRPAEFFRPRDPHVRDRIRRSLGIAAEAVVCLTAARCAEVKGFRYQIEAIRRLRATPAWQSLVFVWAGDGPLLEPFREQVQAEGLADRVLMLGQRNDVADLLDAADIFVLPSEHEGMPLAIIEAMAKGVGVIATSVSGIPEQLGDTGCLVPDPVVDPALTIDGLVTGITRWTEDRGLLEAAAASGRDRARRMFQSTRMIEQTRGVIERARLPPHDYASPGLAFLRLDDSFPNLAATTAAAVPWKHVRDEIPHAFYVDRRLPGTGCVNRDEAILLHNLALPFRGRRGLEIGCWIGWSAAHIAAAGVLLDVVDPALANPAMLETVRSSLRHAGVAEQVFLHDSASPAGIDQLARAGRRWAFIFIDGNHEAPHPLFDAATAVEFAEQDALVVFHDLASPDVAQALEYLRQRGWNTCIYSTTQIVGAAWRGQVTPPAHAPDPRVVWHVPKHLRQFPLAPTTAPIDRET